MVYKTKEIANVFRSYYGALYSINQKGKQEMEKTEKIREFVKHARLPQ